MKINKMPIKDRFDDLIDRVVALKASLEEQEDEDVRLGYQIGDCEMLFRRLTKLRDYILEELNSKKEVG